MPNKRRRTVSNRGTVVDFDLLEVKSQMENKPIPQSVTARENYIENKLKRRRDRRAALAASNTQAQQSEADNIKNTETIEKPKKTVENTIPVARKIKRKRIGD